MRLSSLRVAYVWLSCALSAFAPLSPALAAPGRGEPRDAAPKTNAPGLPLADPPGIDWAAAGAEVAQVLSGYLRVDTVNPPGTETAGAQYLAGVLEAAGIPSEIWEYAPGRGTLVARLEGADQEPPLCLLSHIDVVPFEGERWPADRGGLSGAIADGYVWGRGALDMKGMGALETMTLVWLKRAGVPLKRDVILIAVADEEVSGGGARFIAQPQNWAKLGCSQLLNEGGLGMRGLIFPDQTLFGISVAEKGTLWARMSVEGPTGHGSRPDPDQAPPRLVRALARLEAYRPRPRWHPSLIELFEQIGATRHGVERFVLERPFLLQPALRGRLMGDSTTRAALTDTINITGIHGGSSTNVVPSSMDATLDCRLLPGTSPEEMKRRLREIVADPAIQFTWDEARESNESPTDDSLFRALQRRAVEGRVDAVAGPVLSVGFTDSIYLRPLGVHAYGFVPFEVSLEDATTMHGDGERVSLDNLREGLRILYRSVWDVVVEGS